MLRSTSLEVDIPVQILRIQSLRHRPHFQSHFTLLFTAPLAGRELEAGVGALGFGTTLALDVGAFTPTPALGAALGAGAGAIRLGCGGLGLLIGLGAVLYCILTLIPGG